MHASGSWQSQLLEYFDSPTLAKGAAYVRLNRVRSLVAEDQTTGAIKIIAKVSGNSNPYYRTELRLRNQGSTVSYVICSCPVGIDCKHAAAVLISYIENRDKTSLIPVHGMNAKPGKPAPPKTVLEKLQDRCPQDFLRELHFIGKTVEVVKADQLEAQVQSAAAATEQRKSFILYILSAKENHIKPLIQMVYVNVKKDGSYGAVNYTDPAKILRDEFNLPKYADDTDAEICSIWESVLDSRSGTRYYGYTTDFSAFTSLEALKVVLAAMMDSKRCRFNSVDGPTLSMGPPCEGSLVWERQLKGYKLIVEATRDNRKMQCLPWEFPFYVDSDGTCGPITLPVPQAALSHILRLRHVQESELSTIPLMLADARLEKIVPVPPGQKPVIVRESKPSPKLTVETALCRRQLANIANPKETVRIARIVVPRSTSEVKYSEDEDGNIVIDRNVALTESECAQELRALGFKMIASDAVQSSSQSGTLLIAEPGAWTKLDAEVLSSMRQNGWTITEETESRVIPLELSDDAFEFEIEEEDAGAAWFALALNIQVDGKKVPLLPLLLSAIRQLPAFGEDMAQAIDALNMNEKLIATMDDGRLISLPFDRVRSILVALQELLNREDKGDKLKISLLHAAELFQNQFLSEAKWVGSERIMQFVERLRKLTQIEPHSPPAGFNATLRPYQAEGVGWLQFLAEQQFGGILADDMGLGKTVQLLAHLSIEKEHNRLTKPFLVVCPTSVLPNWVAESAKFAPQLKVLPYTGADRASQKELLKSVDVVVTTYPLLSRDIADMKKIHWHGIALDEAQAIKNPGTQVAIAVRTLKAGYRFCLTGTPIENHLGELWSHFHFLLPGLLGDQTNFTKRVRSPIEKAKNLSLKEALGARVKPFILRRTKAQVVQELPAKTVIVQPIELTGDQRDLYETVRIASSKRVLDEVKQKGFKQSQIMILDALLKLRQVCCDPRLVKLPSAAKVQNSAKLEHLTDMLQQLIEEGRKILLFSQFTSMLDLIGENLNANGIPFVQLRGDTKDRKTPVEQFQAGEVPVFLISLKAGGTGLNLTAADVVIHYDPWWNPAVEDQATDRAHRIGQDKKVFVYKLIAQGTIEQRMTELQERKRVLANCIYDENNGLSMSFTEDDLQSLLRPLGE